MLTLLASGQRTYRRYLHLISKGHEMTIVFNNNVSQYANGDFATFKDEDVNGIARANGYVNAGYATVVVAYVAPEIAPKADEWGEEKPLKKTK